MGNCLSLCTVAKENKHFVRAALIGFIHNTILLYIAVIGWCPGNVLFVRAGVSSEYLACKLIQVSCPLCIITHKTIMKIDNQLTILMHIEICSNEKVRLGLSNSPVRLLKIINPSVGPLELTIRLIQTPLYYRQ